MKSKLSNLHLVFLVLALLVVSCGDTTSQSSGAGGGAPSASASGSGSGGGGSTGNGGQGGISLNASSGMGTGGGSGGSDSCVGETSTAELIPLDMYIMLDRSGSMLDKTGMMGQGIPKWDAVTQALGTFFNDPQSVGLGVGLQYFPLRAPGAPASCTTNAQCGMYGPCLLKTCSNQGVIVPCNNNNDCPTASQCVNLGQCANDTTTYCLPIGASCPGNKGQCVQVMTSICLNEDSCDAADYAAPAVEVATLGGAATALIGSMNMVNPEGGTPTAPALQGAIDHARTWASANPTHTVIALLATDGLPTECTPTDIGGIAQIAASGVSSSPSIATFVIGVFAGNDMTAKANLDQIAMAGGTQQAFLVDSNQNVSQAFLDALNAIRGTKLACEYQIPQPPPGDVLDYGKVNVEHTAPGQSQPTTVYYVAKAADCDPVIGGWYYDVDPMNGGTPTKIIMCPATCTAFEAGGQVDIRLGCKTEIPPPK